MDSTLLEKVLSCNSLPSLPAVAVRVIELTSDINVSLDELAKCIQNDQGLAAKILRTVNSSFYALRQPCGSVQKSLVMLGLSPVKTLALGFSLISSVEATRTNGFDYVSYWRRGLYTAVGAKCFAESTRRPFADEAFLVGLLQDIGQMAMYMALRDRYLQAIAPAKQDHSKVASLEASAFELGHAEVGAMLAERWKLPTDLVAAVRFHERPTAAPQRIADLARTVALGSSFHDSMTDSDPSGSLARLYQRADQWFGLDVGTARSAVRRANDGVRELSSLFSLDTGSFADADQVMERAERGRAELEVVPWEPGPEVLNLLTNEPELDPLTGLIARSAFDGALRQAMKDGRAAGLPVSLLQIGIGSRGTKLQTDILEASDEAVIELSQVLRKYFQSRGMVSRLSEDIFAVILMGTARTQTLFEAERCLAELRGGTFGRRGAWAAIGVAFAATGTEPGPTSARELVVAATKSLGEASRLKGERVVEHTVAKAA